LSSRRVVVGVPRGAIVGASDDRNREPAGCATLGGRNVDEDDAGCAGEAATGVVVGVAGDVEGVRGTGSAIVFIGSSTSRSSPWYACAHVNVDDGSTMVMRREQVPPVLLIRRLAIAVLLVAATVVRASAQAGFGDDRVMLQGFYWESYRHGHPQRFPSFGDKRWYAIVRENAPAIREARST